MTLVYLTDAGRIVFASHSLGEADDREKKCFINQSFAPDSKHYLQYRQVQAARYLIFIMNWIWISKMTVKER